MSMSEFYDDDLPSYKIIILGRTRSGKTKLLTRYKFSTYTDSNVPTIGVDTLLIKKKNTKFFYYDTAGQDRYRSIISSYYRQTDACLLVYDVSSHDSFD